MKYLLITLGFITSLAFAQSDEKSDKILNQLSKEIKALNSFYLEFNMKINNPSTGEDSNQNGKGYVQGDKFNAELGDNLIISNGLKVWTVVKDSKVVYESDADEDDNETMNPKQLMTIWETGFKNKYDKETTFNNKKVHVINLYPTNPGEVQYHTIILYINQDNNELAKAIMKTKDGSKMTYEVTKFSKNVEVTKDKFVYDARKYPGYQLIRD